MKNFKIAMMLIFGLMVFSIFCITFQSIGAETLIHSPVDYIIEQLATPDALVLAGFSAAPLVWADGSENMGGFRNYLYLIPTADIVTEAQLPPNPTTSAQHVTLDGSHTLENGKYFKKIYASPGTVKYTPENQGETDGQSFKPKGEFFFPGSGDDVNALARQVNNGNFIMVLVEENGKRVQVGSKGHPARIKPGADLGMVAADRKGFKFEFEADHFVPVLRYNGTIPLSESITEPAIS